MADSRGRGSAAIAQTAKVRSLTPHSPVHVEAREVPVNLERSIHLSTTHGLKNAVRVGSWAHDVEGSNEWPKCPRSSMDVPTGPAPADVARVGTWTSPEPSPRSLPETSEDSFVVMSAQNTPRAPHASTEMDDSQDVSLTQVLVACENDATNLSEASDHDEQASAAQLAQCEELELQQKGEDEVVRTLYGRDMVPVDNGLPLELSDDEVAGASDSEHLSEVLSPLDETVRLGPATDCPLLCEQIAESEQEESSPSNDLQQSYRSVDPFITVPLSPGRNASAFCSLTNTGSGDEDASGAAAYSPGDSEPEGATADAVDVEAALGWVKMVEEVKGPKLAECFQGARPDKVQQFVIPVCVPVYNEEGKELVATLSSISRMQQTMRAMHKDLENFEVKVCIIQDGYAKASESFKSALRIMFPATEYQYGGRGWEDEVLDAVEAEVKLTCVLQAPQDRCISLGDLAVRDVLGDELGQTGEGLSEALPLDITVLLKADNRKKVNSHDLFFRGFANHYNPEFVFATDCGTLFDDNCLGLLVRKILRKKDCVAVTGRQRVMSREMQPDCESEGCMGWMLRCVQGYDYESSVVLFNGCFSKLGFLPVIPGPCGLFRLPPLLEVVTIKGEQKSPMDFYLDAAEEAEKSKTMLHGNCMLAEDRVLTFAAEFLTTGEKRVHWCKNAIFYFQAETELRQLVGQRRRWLNGTIAAYFYVHSELADKRLPSSHPRWKIFLLRTLIKLMLAIYGGIAVGPSLYAYGVCEALQYLWSCEPDVALDSGSGNTIPTSLPGIFQAVLFGIAALYFLSFVFFSICHHRSAFDPRLFALCGFLNAVAMTIMMWALVLSTIEGLSVVQWFGFVYLVVPILLNLFIPNFESLKHLLHPLRVVVFFLFMPTMQGNFLTLAIARTFDLSWGNRDGIGAKEDGLKNQTYSYMILQWLANGVLLVLLFSFDSSIWLWFIQLALAMVLLTPTMLLSLGSAMQLLGIPFVALGMVMGACLILCRVGWVDSVLFDGEQLIASFLTTSPIFHMPVLQVTGVLLLLIGLKSVRRLLRNWIRRRRRQSVKAGTKDAMPAPTAKSLRAVAKSKEEMYDPGV